ncbi:MAG: penicillin-binding protein 2 [Gammaproteobacteria bacterium WSBS_2016_MAG_OTU1]
MLTEGTNTLPKGRLLIFGLAALIMACLLAWRWHNLQVSRFSHYSQLAHDNQLSILPVEPPRGQIFDRNGAALAINETVYSLKVGSDFAGDVLGKIDALRRAIRISDDAVKKLDDSRRSQVYKGVITLREKLTEEEVVNFLSWQFLFPEIVLESELARYYPLGDSAGHVIGHVGRVSEKDRLKIKAASRESLYQGAKFIGKTGVELIYEQTLRGELGAQEAQVDAHGRILGRAVRRQPTPGRDIYLTLDMRLQSLAESLLVGESGAAVVMDVNTGELLALASSPRFDINKFVFGISVADWKVLNTSSQKPLIHRAIYGQYAPGSTIKPFLALTALQHGWRDKDYRYHSKGFFQLGNHRYHDWKKGGHGVVDISRSIIRSVNTFYYTLGNEIGIDKLHEGLLPFGFGLLSGVDLDNEKNGILPSTEWKERVRGEKWIGGETVSASVGQGYLQATPLQMAVAMCMIANGGRQLRPYIYQQDGNATNHVFDKEFLDLIQDALAKVTVPGGTAPGVGRDALYGIAGKTGTAQVVKLKLDATGERIKNEDLPKKYRDHAWFVGYAPVESPQVAVAVIVENGGSGGRIAGPISRQLLDQYLLTDNRLPQKEIDEEGEEKDIEGEESNEQSPEDNQQNDSDEQATETTETTETALNVLNVQNNHAINSVGGNFIRKARQPFSDIINKLLGRAWKKEDKHLPAQTIVLNKQTGRMHDA